MTSNERIVHELQGIKRILILHNIETIDAYLNEVVNSASKRIMWMNIDGVNNQGEIASASGVLQPAVSKFLKVLKAAVLVEYDSKTQPRKIIDHTPANWLELITKDDKLEE